MYATMHAQTFAALRSIVGIPSWTITTFHAAQRVDALPFAVTPAVVFGALVYV